MFYQEPPDRALRFGDVVDGFVLLHPLLKEPLLDHRPPSYSINVKTRDFAAVLSPCCSIAHHTIALAPLQHIRPVFYQNPYLEEDFTRVNRKMPAEKTVPPHKWERIPQDIKERDFHLDKDDYAFADFFVYEQHIKLPSYIIDVAKRGQLQTGFYMIDFKTICTVNCEAVKSPTDSPVEAKILQLSIAARSHLREKLSAYFARVPPEDEI